MGRPRDLLKKEEITFDNHHPATAAEWDDDLHFHKRMTVNNPKGKQTVVSGVFHVKKNRGVGVTYDKGKEHPKIKDKTEREYFERKIKKEISDVIENSNDEARVFIDRVVTAVDSLSTGEITAERVRRKNEAFDNVMDALGISPKIKVSLRNRNNDLLSLYVEASSSAYALYGLMYLTRTYSRYYHYLGEAGFVVYYIVENDNQINMGELTPYSFLKYKRQGFGITIGRILNNVEEVIEQNWGERHQIDADGNDDVNGEL